MTKTLRASASALAFAFMPGAALALTAEAAWESWQRAADEAGVALTAAAEAREGDTLTLRGVAFAADTEDGTTFSGTLDQVSLTETDDGSVTVEMPESYPISVSGLDSGGTPSEATLTISHPDLSLVMSDAAEGGTSTAFEAPVLEVEVTELSDAEAPEDLEGRLTMTGLSGTSARTGGDVPQIDTDIAVENTVAMLSGTDPETGGRFDFEMTFADIASRSSGTLTTLFAATEDLGTLIDQGFSTEGEGSVGEITFALSSEGTPESFDAEGSVASASGSGRIDAERFAYDISYEGVSFNVSGSEIPLPQVTGGLGELRTRIALPSGPTEEAQPMAFTVALRDLTLGEEIWSLFDPQGMLPRDPATAVVDLSGSIRFLADIFSEEAMETDEVPAEVEEVALEEMRLALAGAELTGEGEMTLDYDAAGPFGPGSPAPDGSFTFRLQGGQALLETLVRMGLLPEEQAMMVRMMTGMLARPGEEPDTLVSDIEIRPDGTVLANGAPLPF